MEEQLSTINSILGFFAALAGLYLFVKEIFDGRHRLSLIIVSILLVTISVGVFIHKPITPRSSFNEISVDESQKVKSQNQINQEYVVNLINNTHRGFSPSTRHFTQEYTAESGYKIVDQSWVPVSENNVESFNVSISDDGSKLILKASIEAGPIFDRWRGWVKGRILTKQVKD